MNFSNFTVASILGGLIFGGIGFVAFVYGKKQGELKPLVIGIILMAYPMFITDTLSVFAIGAILTLGLFLFN